MINRRTFIKSIIASLGSLTYPTLSLALIHPKDGKQHFFSAMSDTEGNHCLIGFDRHGSTEIKVPLPGRGHAPSLSSDGKQLIMTARRPDNWLMIVDAFTGHYQRMNGHPNRHYYGHGVFSPDNHYFYATENDFDHQRGVIGIYDTHHSFKRVDEFYSGGIGPHELLLTPDGQSLIVANGGILTHPDTGRSKLNVNTMSPSLTVIRRSDGQITHKTQLPKSLHQLSIRHITVNKDFTVGLAFQYQGAPSKQLPLVGLWQPNQEVRLLNCPKTLLRRMKNYCGSIAMDSSGTVMAVSAPRGGLISYWSATNGQWLSSMDVKDGCGVTASGKKGEFLISSGYGELILHRPIADNGTAQTTHLLHKKQARWDNHLA